MTKFRSKEGVLKTGMLHTLWSKAVGTKDYVKEEWRQLATMIEEGQKACEILEKLNENHSTRR